MAKNSIQSTHQISRLNVDAKQWLILRVTLQSTEIAASFETLFLNLLLLLSQSFRHPLKKASGEFVNKK